MAQIGLPDIDVVFQQLAVSAIERSQRGITSVIVQDDTATGESVKLYRYLTDVKQEDYSSDNYNAISKCFLTAVNRVYVIKVDTNADFAAATALLEGIKYNYVCSTVADFQEALVSYLVNKNAKSAGKKHIAVVANATVADSKYIVNVKNSSVTYKDGGVISIVEYLPRLTAVLANLPMNRSITYYELEELADVDRSFVTDEEDVDYWINKGNIVLIKDEDVVKVGRGVNTLTTFTSTESEDMRKIIIVESMNLILEDIYNTFKNSYVGKYKNSYDNQCLFISAINAYFRQLAKEEILDPAFENIAYVDVEAQRQAWLSIGKLEAADWNEKTVKNMTFKSYIYLAGQIKILDAIEDLKFVIVMA